MARNLFSVPIFFIVFRETLEAAIILSVLLGLVEQLVHEELPAPVPTQTQISNDSDKDVPGSPTSKSDSLNQDAEDNMVQKRRLIRKLRIQVQLPNYM
jgi:high-affinity iron transporter